MVTHGSLRVDDISLIVRKIYPFMSETHKRKICCIEMLLKFSLEREEWLEDVQMFPLFFFFFFFFLNNFQPRQSQTYLANAHKIKIPIHNCD